jgi:hypothetical protein
MSHIISSKLAKTRVAKWLATEGQHPKLPGVSWTETRQALIYDGHTYLVSSGQVFQCGHCGHWDPDWVAHEVLDFFKETFGVKPVEIEITCTL